MLQNESIKKWYVNGKIFMLNQSFFFKKAPETHYELCCLRDVFHGLESIKYSLSTPFQ